MEGQVHHSAKREVDDWSSQLQRRPPFLRFRHHFWDNHLDLYETDAGGGVRHDMEGELGRGHALDHFVREGERHRAGSDCQELQGGGVVQARAEKGEVLVLATGNEEPREVPRCIEQKEKPAGESCDQAILRHLLYCPASLDQSLRGVRPVRAGIRPPLHLRQLVHWEEKHLPLRADDEPLHVHVCRLRLPHDPLLEQIGRVAGRGRDDFVGDQEEPERSVDLHRRFLQEGGGLLVDTDGSGCLAALVLLLLLQLLQEHLLLPAHHRLPLVCSFLLLEPPAVNTKLA